MRLWRETLRAVASAAIVLIVAPLTALATGRMSGRPVTDPLALGTIQISGTLFFNDAANNAMGSIVDNGATGTFRINGGALQFTDANVALSEFGTNGLGVDVEGATGVLVFGVDAGFSDIGFEGDDGTVPHIFGDGGLDQISYRAATHVFQDLAGNGVADVTEAGFRLNVTNGTRLVAIRKYSITTDLASIPAQQCTSVNITTTGTVDTNDTCTVLSTQQTANGLVGLAWVSAASTVQGYWCNVTTGAQDVGSATYDTICFED